MLTRFLFGNVKVAALGLRFVCELAALAAFVWWGWPFVGVLIAVAVAIFWGAFVGPKSNRRLQDPWRFAAEVVIFAGATAAFAAVGQSRPRGRLRGGRARHRCASRRWPEP